MSALCGGLPAHAAPCPLSQSQIKEQLSNGQRIWFDFLPSPQNESAEYKQCRTIQANWIADLVDKNKTISVPLNIVNGYFVGNLNLSKITFREPVLISSSDFEGEVLFDDSTFASEARFDSSLFSFKADFGGVHAHDVLSFLHTRFSLQSFFNHLDAGTFTIADAQFDNPQFFDMRITENLNAQDVTVKFDANFDNSTINGSADLRGIQGRSVTFRNAQLGSLDISNSPLNRTTADFADFTGMKVTNFLNANQATIGHVDLQAAHIGEALNFAGAHFGPGVSGVGLNLGNVVVGGLTNLGSFDDLGNELQGAHFEGRAIARGSHLLGGLESAGAIFDGEVDFSGAEILGDVLFEEHEHIRKPFPCSTEFEVLPHARQCAAHLTTVFKGPVSFSEAIIKGRFSAVGAEFEQAVTLDGIQIDRSASVSVANSPTSIPDKIYAESRTVLQDSFSASFARFLGPFSMDGANIAGSASFEGTQFRAVDFRNVTIQGTVDFRSATEKKNGYSDSATHFEGPADFRQAHLENGVDFAGTTFDESLDFTQAEISENLLISDSNVNLFSQFKGPVLFNSSVVKGRFVAVGSRFEGGAKFDGIDIQGDANFADVRFKNGVSFHLAEIGGVSNFADATFAGDANFASVKFDSDAVFTNGQFQDGATFDTSNFRGTALFDNRGFRGNAPASFQAVHYEQPVSFQGASFERGAIFVSTIADKSFSLGRSWFGGPVSFRHAHLSSVSFGDEEEDKSKAANFATFMQGVDLRGFTYDSISIPSWRDMLLKQSPFDRQPYVQLEKVFRATGLNEEADKVYYARHEREGNQARWREPLEWLWDRGRRYLTGYGVALTPIIATSLSVLLLGSFVFSRPGAVTQKEGGSNEATPPQVPKQLNWFDSFAVSLRLLSGIDLPSGSEWVPSEGLLVDLRIWKLRYATYGTIQRIVGLLLVPIAAAAILDTLQRPGQ